jgi:hypothetical protein
MERTMETLFQDAIDRQVRGTSENRFPVSVCAEAWDFLAVLQR